MALRKSSRFGSFPSFTVDLISVRVSLYALSIALFLFGSFILPIISFAFFALPSLSSILTNASLEAVFHEAPFFKASNAFFVSAIIVP